MELPSTQLLTETQAAAILGCSPNTLRTWRCQGIGPNFVKVCDRMVRYKPDDIEAFVQSCQEDANAN
jgi:hypothetical protein